MEHDRGVFVEGRDEIHDKRSGYTMTWRLVVEHEKGDINELADAFIKNFHNHLRTQREESSKHCQETIAQGV
ncbi:hypothetical protein Dsin_019048 [Dipteronia sinensis]|uniref:Uncharacterized protein n=1 Tax=Dipteronia sinensis TaxID=43782 RepID=A0AAE0E252_9ROSI|nr:hypothetical protein Dsin_019048 [Dipteronia sinensis]